MARISTFVFFDIETSGLPAEENNRTRITELSMVAVRRDHILEQGELLKSSGQPMSVCPRVINKLTLCLNPRKMVSIEASSKTGLTNELLEDQVSFNKQVFTKLDNFLNILEKPLCLVSHNGLSFDFPILKNHLEKLNVHFSEDILCADSLYAVYDIHEDNKKTVLKKDNSYHAMVKWDSEDEFCLLTSMQAVNEVTPKKRKLTNVKRSGKKRKIYYEGNPKPDLSFSVESTHKRVVGGTPLTAHRAEDDCMMLLEISVKIGEDFVQWVDENHCLFQDIKPMTPGVRLGD